jgi:hypothetical protein
MKLSTADIVRTQAEREAGFKEKGSTSPRKADEGAMWEAQLAAARSISNPELRAREEAYVLEKLKKLEKAKQTREKDEVLLREAESRRKKEDLRVRGFQSSGLYTHALPLRNAHESLAEQALEQDLREAGEATGHAWVKTESGWTRRHNPVLEKKSELSENELSTQAYEAVDFRFGLRRSRSWDYVLAVSCLTVLLRQYGAVGARSLQNLMHRDVGVTMKTYLRFPQATAAVLELLRECTAVYGAVRRAQGAAGQSVVVAEERLRQAELWLAQVSQDVMRRTTAKQAAALGAAAVAAAAAAANNGQVVEEVAETDWGGSALPHEVLLTVFGFLSSARDLVRVTAVCTRWYDAGNDDFLYRKLLARSDALSREEVEIRVAKVKSYKTVFMQLHSKLLMPMTGLYLCSVCDCLFWAGKNVARHCQVRREFERHQPGVALTPQTLVQGLLVRKIGAFVVSELTLFVGGLGTEPIPPKTVKNAGVCDLAEGASSGARWAVLLPVDGPAGRAARRHLAGSVSAQLAKAAHAASDAGCGCCLDALGQGPHGAVGHRRARHVPHRVGRVREACGRGRRTGAHRASVAVVG